MAKQLCKNCNRFSVKGRKGRCRTLILRQLGNEIKVTKNTECMIGDYREKK